MKPDIRFLKQPKHFWANVRTISQGVGYTVRKQGQIRVPSADEVRECMTNLSLGVEHLLDDDGVSTPLGRDLFAYFKYRATSLNQYVAPRLMDADQAKKAYEKLCARLTDSRCPVPMNKQSGNKKAPAYFTAMINMLIEEHAQGRPCDFDPRTLTTITVDKSPLRTLSRRVDGAFPSSVNPLAIWEIKEYYYTTTFGSRVADGVYETLLDGMELEELRKQENIHVKHYLMVDSRYTWWECGRSYLCRIFDMLHMGYVDEVLFGTEIFEELPRIVAEWVASAKKRKPS